MFSNGQTATRTVETDATEPRGRFRSKRIVEMIARRNAARAAKNLAEADQLRDELAALGVAIKDNKDGTTTWEPKR